MVLWFPQSNMRVAEARAGDVDCFVVVQMLFWLRVYTSENGVVKDVVRTAGQANGLTKINFISSLLLAHSPTLVMLTKRAHDDRSSHLSSRRSISTSISSAQLELVVSSTMLFSP